MNYVDNEYIIDILLEFLKEADSHEVKIHFPSGKIMPLPTDEKRKVKIAKSIGYYNDWLPEHANSHNVDLKRLDDIHLIAKGTLHGVRYRIKAIDDRGVEYDIPIRNTI
jgi:hypothetical protein